MAFKTLLIPLDGFSLNEATLETALAAAQRFRAHIEVLYVRPAVDVTARYATVNLPESLARTVAEAAERSAAEQSSEIRAAFEKFCRSHKLAIAEEPSASPHATASLREERGYGPDILVRRGRVSDLIFVQRPGQSPPLAQTVETALLETGRPVVVAPPAPQRCVASHVAIGWNASAEAARAVASALPCLAGAEKVTILASQKRAGSAEELADSLRWHGIKPAVRIFGAGGRSVGATLLAESHELGADLLVIGGYTHTRVRQLLFGGVTSHVLEAADIPVMMAH